MRPILSKNKPELKHVGLDFVQPIMKEFLNTEYLHYGYWEAGVDVNFLNVRKAQDRFVDLLVEHIPKGAQSILDVGSGTGEIAKTLVQKKHFSVDCVSPSYSLNRCAQEKLGLGSVVTTDYFQDFRTDKTYDLILFSESFQYVPIADALHNAERLANHRGYVLLCDFFRNDVKEKSPIGGGHDLKKFYAALAKSPFDKIEDLDVTDFMAPTADLREYFMRRLVIPMGDSCHSYFSARNPAIFTFLLWVFRGRLKKFKRKYVEQSIDATVFKKFKSYRLILLQKK